MLSRARAALDAGRYEVPAGRNALDLYQAVLLAKPDNTEARNGLERTIDAILAAADAEWRSGDTAEAERMNANDATLPVTCSSSLRIALSTSASVSPCERCMVLRTFA